MRRILILLLLSLRLSPAFAGNEGGVVFVKNEGQWQDNILFRADLSGGSVFLEADKLTFVLFDNRDLHDRLLHNDRSQPLTLDCHAWHMRFEDASHSVSVNPASKRAEYRNYFIGNDPERWKGQVPVYESVTYENLWPGISLVLYSKGGDLKYDLVVSAHADAGRIAFRYEGITPTLGREGELEFSTTFRTLTELAPVAFQNEHEVRCGFSLKDNRLGFHMPDPFSHESELRIDPQLIFSTFTGSTADNFGYTATYDTLGNLYAGGIAFGVGYPVSVGAFQGSFGGGGTGGAWTMNGGVDISITKFNPTGTAIVWSSYLGGSFNEQPHSLITTPAGELVVYGITWSTNYPTTNGAYSVANAGASDIVLTKFDAAGATLLGSTYFGGTASDGMNITSAFTPITLKFNYGDDARGEVMLDAANNIYVASCTQSADFPVSPGAFQASTGGSQDAIVAKFNPALTTLQWSTYLGGSAADACYGIRVTPTSEVYVVGGTASGNFPTTPGSIQPSYGGAVDGFVSHLNSSGTSMVAGTYLGTNMLDQTYCLDFDGNGDLYVLGQTLGAWPVSPGVYFNANGKQFIQKMNPALTTVIFSTVFGTGGFNCDISPAAFLVDICGYIYMSGWGSTIGGWGGNNGTTNNMPITPNAYQSTTDGNDFYLMVMKPNATGLEFATYFGGPLSREHVDGGTSRFNKNLQVYQAVCAGCGNHDDFPTTPGAVSSTNNSFNCNLGAFKFQLDAQTITANFVSTQAAGCSPFPVSFNNTSTGGLSFFWDFGDGATDTAMSPTHVYLTPGTYLAKLVITDTSACNPADSVTRTVIVYGNPTVTVFSDSFACAGNPVQLHASGGVSYQWFPTAGLSDPTIANPIAHPTAPTTYQVIVTSQNGCSDTGTVYISMNPWPADAGPVASFCEGGPGGQLHATPLGGVPPYYYQWWCDSTNTFCGLDSINDDDPFAIPSVSTTYYVQITDANGCRSTIDSTQVIVLINPVVDAGPDVYVCHAPGPGDFIHAQVINMVQAPGPYVYHWLPGAGLNDTTVSNPYARPDTTTIYTLLATSINGCTSHPTTVDTLSSVTVHVKPLPIANAGPDQHICFLDSIQLPGQGYNAGPLYDFEWSPASGLDDSTASTPMASPSLTTDYILVVWSNGCPSYGDTMVLNVHTLPTVDAGPDKDICLFDNTTLSALAWGDPLSAGYQYFWFPGNGIIGSPQAQSIQVSPDTTTLYYVFATSQYGCTSPPDSARIVLRPTPVADAGPNLFVCWGDSFQLNGAYHYEGTGPVTDTTHIFYQWSPATGLDSPQTRITRGIIPSTQQYTFTVTYQTCVTEDTVIVFQYPDLAASVSADTINFCSGDTVQLYGGTGVANPAYHWMPAGSLSDSLAENPFAWPDDTTTYLLAISEGGCNDTGSITLNAIPMPVASFLHSTPQICEGDEVNFLETAVNDINWIWNFGDGSAVSNRQNPSHLYLSAGEYAVSLIALAPGGCRDTSETQSIVVSALPRSGAWSDPAAPVAVELPGTAVSFYQRWPEDGMGIWNFSDGASEAGVQISRQFRQAGTYWVELYVISPAGCIRRDTLGPYIVTEPRQTVGNIFSPNGDGISDFFLAEYTGDQPFRLRILDRWGTLVYVTNDKNKPWNGKTMNGEDAPEGVYFYLMQTGDKEKAGNLTLLR